MSAISLVFWTDIRLHQNQVHRGAAESAEGVFSYDPIGRRRLDHKLSPCLRRGFGRQAFGNRFRLHFMAMGLQESFLFGGLSPPNKKITSLRP